MFNVFFLYFKPIKKCLDVSIGYIYCISMVTPIYYMSTESDFENDYVLGMNIDDSGIGSVDFKSEDNASEGDLTNMGD